MTLTEAGGTLGYSEKSAHCIPRVEMSIAAARAGVRTHLGCGVWAVSEMAIEKFSIWGAFFGGVSNCLP